MLENIIYGMTLRSLGLRNKRNEFHLGLISKIKSVPSLNSFLEISKEHKVSLLFKLSENKPTLDLLH